MVLLVSNRGIRDCNTHLGTVEGAWRWVQDPGWGILIFGLKALAGADEFSHARTASPMRPEDTRAEQTFIALRVCETSQTLQWLYTALAFISLFWEVFALEQLLQYLPVKPLNISSTLNMCLSTCRAGLLSEVPPGEESEPRGTQVDAAWAGSE